MRIARVLALLLCLIPCALAQRDDGFATGPGAPPDVRYLEQDWQWLWFLCQDALVPQPDPEVPVAEEHRRRALPALIGAARADEALVRAAARMALAKAGDPAARDVLVEGLEEASLAARRDAALALGVLGDAASAPLLRERLLDAKQDGEVRLAAGIALGLLQGEAGAEVVHPARADFLAWLEPKAFAALDTPARTGAALGAGLTRDRALAPAVAALLQKRGKKLLVADRACLLLSLGKLQDRKQDAVLTKALKDDDAKVRRAAALGVAAQGAGTGDAALIRALARQEDDEPDLLTRGIQTFALGWIGGSAALRTLADRAFARTGGSIHPITRAPRLRLSARDTAAFGALALGIVHPEAFRAGLERQLGEEEDHGQRAAFALALGLFARPESGRALVEAFEDSADPRLRGYLALALGMSRAPLAIAPLEKALREAKGDELVPALARGLALVDAKRARTILLERLETAGSGELPALLYALGRVGDAASVDPLLARLENGPVNARAFAAVALGDVLDRHAPRRLADLLTLFDSTIDPTLFRSFLAVR